MIDSAFLILWLSDSAKLLVHAKCQASPGPVLQVVPRAVVEEWVSKFRLREAAEKYCWRHGEWLHKVRGTPAGQTLIEIRDSGLLIGMKLVFWLPLLNLCRSLYRR